MYVLYMELKKQRNHIKRLQQNPDTKRERWVHGYNLNFGSFSFLEWLLKNGRVFLVRHLFCFTGGRKRRMYTINKLKKESVKLTVLEISNLGKLHPIVFPAIAQDWNFTKSSSAKLNSSGIHAANSIALHFQKRLKKIPLQETSSKEHFIRDQKEPLFPLAGQSVSAESNGRSLSKANQSISAN